MDVQVERCVGIDIGKKDLKACLRTPGSRKGSFTRDTRTFPTTTAGLLRLRDWLVAERVQRVAMESTGVFWKPVFYMVEDAVAECWLVNPQHLKKVPGRKSDVSDAAWIAQLAQVGLLRPSFVPPPPIRRLRDLTRYRTVVVRDHTREVQRLQAVLEDAGIKLSSVATDITGVSGRAMIAALIAGQRDPNVLADLARGTMRRKTADLTEALTGHFGAHHARLCQLMVTRLDQLDAAVASLDELIDAELAPFPAQLKRRDQLDTIPGVGRYVAEVILAETGGDMTRFRTAQDLTSWAGLCPGTNESAGRQLPGRTRKGDRWLRGALGDAAAGAARTNSTYLGARYHRLARRRGKKRALVATSRMILEAAWWIMTHDVDYVDLGYDHYERTQQPRRRAERLAEQLRQLGYPVELPKVA